MRNIVSVLSHRGLSQRYISDESTLCGEVIVTLKKTIQINVFQYRHFLCEHQCGGFYGSIFFVLGALAYVCMVRCGLPAVQHNVSTNLLKIRGISASARI